MHVWIIGQWGRLRGPLLQGKGHIIYKHKNIYTSVTQSGVVLNGVIKSKYRYQNAKREGGGVAGKPHCKGMQKTREVMEKKRVHLNMKIHMHHYLECKCNATVRMREKRSVMVSDLS